MAYFSIAVKLIVGMIGILVFLRIAGKAQMAQLTPLDTVRWPSGLPSTSSSASACAPPCCDA